MKLITKNTDYAIRALMYLSRNPGRCVASTEIAQSEGIPKQYLRNILRLLKQDGILESKEGACGGVKFRRRPEDVYITGIIRLFQGNIEMADCMFRKSICPERGRCVLRARIKAVERKLKDEFSGISIGTLKNDLESRPGRRVKRGKP
ncbi:MAG TPA: Rrf2 family transcriptional regulator [Elusimicrobia bacterium]|nr:MAG: hypothetical protein A2386_04940 [Elusimicrobia bacterium RIFOXYB1_FULL_48_9]OGS15711.1 MAG: hypothetical protein A2251_08475 [Elusimicrobia bacterium RIFOXYA2_FULL_47_53]OGS27070.1 MAG: hypothetical protein A2339_01145 [Elusimicrobia bacterium RIFOXYB12_FULL_50_12]OGS31012.1 MAG: hypothetical protein A2323_06795 [Elusimicrobia bacterium RIFOXYB2_FULL_46_23]HBU70473.1 Rrf2 family transcriptional regulator [Elusimicrobiota bacterium]